MALVGLLVALIVLGHAVVTTRRERVCRRDRRPDPARLVACTVAIVGVTVALVGVSTPIVLAVPLSALTCVLVVNLCVRALWTYDDRAEANSNR